jgi:hypothetical protein
MHRVQQLPTFVDGRISHQRWALRSTNFALSSTHNAETRCLSHCYNASSLSLTPGREGISIAFAIERLPLQTNFVPASPLKFQMTFMLDRNHITRRRGVGAPSIPITLSRLILVGSACVSSCHTMFSTFWTTTAALSGTTFRVLHG